MSRVRMGLWLGLLLGVLLALPAKADTVVYYHTDALRSVTVVTNAQGQVIERTHYAPYGQVLNRPLRDGPGYGGHEEDAATGLVYMQQRYYDPESGRFLSVDPVQTDGNGGSFNRYAYAKDNPYRYTDPDGRAAGASCSTGTHLSGQSCASLGVKVIQVGSPSLSQMRKSASTHGSGSASARPMMLASNKDHTVAKEEAANGTVAFAQEAKLLAEHGVLDKLTPALFRAMVEMGARGTVAANTAIEIGKASAGVAGLTFTDAMADIRFYKASQTIPPTGRYYPGSLINWGRLDWRPFDPGLSQPPPKVWQNFVNGVSQLPGYSQ